MIHYHGTPAGGSRQDAARFLQGRHALVPFFRQDDLGIVAEVCQSFCFDNSAFSIWSKGGQLDVDGYTGLVEAWHRHPGFDWALIPDVIDGDEDGIRREHFDLIAQCPRCGERYLACKIHGHWITRLMTNTDQQKEG